MEIQHLIVDHESIVRHIIVIMEVMIQVVQHVQHDIIVHEIEIE